MATRKTAKIPKEFEEIKKALVGDRAHCAVIALAAITKLPPKQVQEALAAAGRKIGRGTYTWTTQRALALLGYSVEKASRDWIQEMIASYPEPHNMLKNVTTHHPRRFKSAWSGQPDMLLFTSGHVAAYVDGKVVDYSVKRSLQITEVWWVEKIA